MKSYIISSRAIVAALCWLTAAVILPSKLAAAEPASDEAILELMRTTYALDRQDFVKEKMQLTEKEAEAFWPLYRKYQRSHEALGDELVKLVLEYADQYPEVSEKRAGELLKGYYSLEKKLADNRAAYIKKFGKILPASKTLRLAQLESRMDLALRLQLASAIPIVPEGKK